MQLQVNGRTQQGMWRIDDIDALRTGMEFIMHPTALVESRELAELIVRLVNAAQEDRERHVG